MAKLQDIFGKTTEELNAMCIPITLGDGGNIVLSSDCWVEENGIRYFKRPIKVDDIEWRIHIVDCNSVIASVYDSDFVYVFAFSTDDASADRLGVDFDNDDLWSKGYAFISGFNSDEVNACVID